MNRLTRRDVQGNAVLIDMNNDLSLWELKFKDRKAIGDAIKRLAEYEEMGFPVINTDIMKKAVQIYGTEAQTDMLIEEMSELIKALLKLRRATKDEPNKAERQEIVNVMEEMADVFIMLTQYLKIIGYTPSLHSFVDYKTKRLAEKLQTTGGGNTNGDVL